MGVPIQLHPRLLLAGLLVAASCDKARETASTAPASLPSPPAARGPTARGPTTHPGSFDPGDLILLRIDGLSTDPEATVETPVRVLADGTIHPLLAPALLAVGLDRATLVRQLSAIYRLDMTNQEAGITVTRLQVARPGEPMLGPIAVGDLVRFAIDGLSVKPNQSRIVVQRVDVGGTVCLPHVAPVHVAGLTDATAALAVADAYRKANVLQGAQVSVLTLERAPADAEHLSLPDGPLQPVPEPLRFLYETR